MIFFLQFLTQTKDSSVTVLLIVAFVFTEQGSVLPSPSEFGLVLGWNLSTIEKPF